MSQTQIAVRAPLRVLALPLYGALAASTRHRVSYFLPELSSRGINVDVAPLLGDDYLSHRFGSGGVSLGAVASGYLRRVSTLLSQGRYDCAWVQGELNPLFPGWLDRALLRIPYVYDFDDAFYLKYAMRGGMHARLLGRKFEQFIAGASVVAAGNEVLQAHALQFNEHVRIVPTVLDHRRYLPAVGSRGKNHFNVGWIGSPSSIRCLKVVAEPLAQLARTGPVRLTVVGGIAPEIPGVEVVNVPWSEDTEVDLIRTFDVGIMPLEDEPWTRGKCAFKLIQYMACGVPAIGSPVGANAEVIGDDAGLLAEGDAQWLAALQLLRDDPQLGARMGAAGRGKVERSYSLLSQVPVYDAILRDAAGKGK